MTDTVADETSTTSGGADRHRTRNRVLVLLALVVIAAAAVAGILTLDAGDSTVSAPRITVAPTKLSGPGTVTGAPDSTAGFDVPDGFTARQTFRPATPLYQPFGGTYLALNIDRKSPQVLAVIIYQLPSAGAPRTDAQRLGLVAAIDRRTAADVTQASRPTILAASPAVTQDGRQQVGARNYDYRTWFVFKRPTSLVQVICQWSTQRTAILDGCQKLVNTLSIK